MCVSVLFFQRFDNMSSPAPETTARPAAAATPESTPGAKESKEKNRGWPKGKKRYPKSPGAPKQPLSGERVLLRYKLRFFQ